MRYIVPEAGPVGTGITLVVVVVELLVVVVVDLVVVTAFRVVRVVELMLFVVDVKLEVAAEVATVSKIASGLGQETCLGSLSLQANNLFGGPIATGAITLSQAGLVAG